jgi:RimJ/RimL family protein N-acetyltransferase
MKYIEKFFTVRGGRDIIVRTAKPKDAKPLIDFMYRISKERIYSIVEPEEFKETHESYRKRIKRFNNLPGKLYLIAEHNKKILGLIQFDNFDHNKCKHNGFLTIFIGRQWRGKGIGRLLMKELLEWAKQNNMIEKVSLSVFSTNFRAIKLYSKLGFRREGRCIKDLKISGKYADSILMYKFVK